MSRIKSNQSPRFSHRPMMLLWALTISACSTTKTAEEQPGLPLDGTVVLESFDKVSKPRFESIIVPARTMLLGKVRIYDMSIRKAPGFKFPVQNKFIHYGSQVVLLKSHNNWVKVLTSKYPKISGWVHRSSIGQVRLNSSEFVISLNDLSGVFAVRRVHKMFDHISRRPLYTSIPKGRRFHLLRQEGSRNLIWIPETNSIGWLDNTHVQ